MTLGSLPTRRAQKHWELRNAPLSLTSIPSFLFLTEGKKRLQTVLN